MTLPLPMPDIFASEKEWKAYMNKLTEDELQELIATFEKRYQEARKRRLELERQSFVAAA